MQAEGLSCITSDPHGHGPCGLWHGHFLWPEVQVLLYDRYSQQYKFMTKLHQ